MIVAIIPVKRLSDAKQRLAGVLSEPNRRSLVLAMLADELSVLQHTTEIGRTFVVSRDLDVDAVAGRFGAHFVEEPPGEVGLNAALLDCIETFVDPQDGILILPADVPTVTSDDILRIIEGAPNQSARVAPSSDGGTNALFLRPARSLTPRFGPDSAAGHLADALAADLDARQTIAESLAHDVDTVEDIQRVAHSETLGPATRRVLSQLFPDVAPLPARADGGR